MAARKFLERIRLASLTTTVRDALAGVADGDVLYNSTLNQAQLRANGVWVPCGGRTPYANFRRTSNQSFTASVAAPVVMNATDDDPFAGLGTPLSRWVVPTGFGGLYMVAGNLAWAANSDTTRRYIWFDVNGGGNTYWLQIVPAVSSASIATWITAAGPLKLAAGDYVELIGRQDSAGAVNLALAKFAIAYLGPA